MSVSTASERAVIVWDRERKVEHFIRTAEFATKAKDIGFMVPTPTVPQLTAADPAVFSTLQRIVEDRYAKEAEAMTAGGAGTAGLAGDVEVVHRQAVAGYDATVLKATDAGAAEAWLKKNEYPVTQTTKEWLAPYVRKGWAITAFKIASGGGGRANLKPVRMSFATDAPIYPYREPRQATTGAPSRMLQVYLLSDSTFDGLLGGQKWVEQKGWSGKLDADEQAEVRSVLGGIPAPATHLTVFEDHSNPRNGTEDVVFVGEPTLAASAELMFLPAIGMGLGVVAWRIRRAASRPKAPR
jgi:hypothetical protein